MKKLFKLTLADKEYEIEQLPRGRSKEVRHKLASFIERFQGNESTSKSIEMTEEMMDLIFEYSPLLAADKERIDAEATDDEVCEAYATIQSVLFDPFHKLAGKVSPQDR